MKLTAVALLLLVLQGRLGLAGMAPLTELSSSTCRNAAMTTAVHRLWLLGRLAGCEAQVWASGLPFLGTSGTTSGAPRTLPWGTAFPLWSSYQTPNRKCLHWKVGLSYYGMLGGLLAGDGLLMVTASVHARAAGTGHPVPARAG
jgi:hypothetical protein